MSNTLLVQDANGAFRKLTCTAAGEGVLAVSVTTDAANTFIPVLQPNGQIAKIAAVDNAGTLTLRTG